MFIYRITNLINGKIYIGQTTHSVESRWKGHCRLAFTDKKYAEKQCPFHKAIKKYGKDNFFVETVDFADILDELNKKEQEWIKKERSLINQNGYNCNLGGDSFGRIFLSESHKEKIKKNNKNKIMCKIVETGEIFDSIADLSRKIGVTVGACRNVLSGLKRTAKGFHLEFLDEERLKKQKEMYKKKDEYIKTHNTFGVKIVCNETGEVFDSIKQAEKKYNILGNAIGQMLSGKKKHVKGLTFKYLK